MKTFFPQYPISRELKKASRKNDFRILSHLPIINFISNSFQLILLQLSTKNQKKRTHNFTKSFKYGLNYIANLIFSDDINKFYQYCKFLSCT